MLRIFCILLFALVLNAAQNQRTLGLESFLGGNTGEKGEIELAKIRIENLKAMKKELEEEARALALKKQQQAPVYVDIDDPQVGELLAQITALKEQIRSFKKDEESKIKASENWAKKDEFVSKQGLYISSDNSIAQSAPINKNTKANTQNTSINKNTKANTQSSEQISPLKNSNKKSAANFEKICKDSNFNACNDFGVSAFSKSDFSTAKRAFDFACNGGINGACANLGITEQRLGNNEAANEILALACDKGSGDACNNLALMKNDKALFVKACELNSALGCANLAILYEAQGDKNADIVRKKACSLGDKNSCG